MTEHEQVIAELLYLKRDCLEGSATDQTLDKAIALLKAQEPVLVTPYTEVEYGFKPKVKVGKCPICGRILNEQANNFCSRCGQAVKWE